jgi:LCP family protein required for cell wall assembly
MRLQKHQIYTLSVFLIITFTLIGVVFAGYQAKVSAYSYTVAEKVTTSSTKTAVPNSEQELTQQDIPELDRQENTEESEPNPDMVQDPEKETEEVPEKTPVVEETKKPRRKPPTEKKDQAQASASPTPAPAVNIDNMPKNQVNILLLGSDYRPESGYRTDVIMLLSINPQYKSVSIVSFPRDLWVTIPGWYEERINVVHQLGGFELLADTFQYNFGVRPDRYVMVDFQGFLKVIDSLGGIEVYAEQNLADQCNHTINPTSWCSVGPGRVHMNSEMALWYSRARYTTSDFDRTRRAQEVVQAVFKKFMSLDAISKAPELYEIYTEYVETNLTLSDVLSLLPMATVILDTENIHRYAVGINETYNWITYSGAMVLIPYYDAIHAILVEALHLDY